MRHRCSVFIHPPQEFRETVLGPQFVLFSSLTSIRRANFVNRVIFSTIPAAQPNRPNGTSVDLSAWDSLAANPDDSSISLMSCLSRHHVRQNAPRVIKYVANIPASSRRHRVRLAIYLVVTSSQYQVQR